MYNNVKLLCSQIKYNMITIYYNIYSNRTKINLIIAFICDKLNVYIFFLN